MKKDEIALQKALESHNFLNEIDLTTNIILKGHLLVEESLYELLSQTVLDTQSLEDANLRFIQLTYIAKSLIQLENPKNLWACIVKLNQIRNKVAHNIDKEKLNQMIIDFSLLNQDSKAARKAYDMNDEIGMMKIGLAYILGTLEGITFSAKP